jgi:hypothetical protein
MHGKNMITTFSALMDLRQRRLAYEEVLDHYSDRLTDAARLSDVVHRKLGREALWVAARSYDRGSAQQAAVDELEEFAFDCWPEAGKLPMYRTLQLRKHIGVKAMPYLQPLILSAFANKAGWWLRRRSWKWRGY